MHQRGASFHAGAGQPAAGHCTRAWVRRGAGSRCPAAPARLSAGGGCLRTLAAAGLAAERGLRGSRRHPVATAPLAALRLAAGGGGRSPALAARLPPVRGAAARLAVAWRLGGVATALPGRHAWRHCNLRPATTVQARSDDATGCGEGAADKRTRRRSWLWDEERGAASAARPRRRRVDRCVAGSAGGAAAAQQRASGGDNFSLGARRHSVGPVTRSARRAARHPPCGRRCSLWACRGRFTAARRGAGDHRQRPQTPQRSRGTAPPPSCRPPRLARRRPREPLWPAL